MRVLSLLLLALALPVHADEAELQRQIDALKAQVERLEKRIEALEAAPPPPAASGAEQPSASPWEALRSGMKPAEVKALLGAPLRRQGGGVELWFYSEAGKAGPFVKFVFGSLQSWRAPGGKSIRSR